MERTRKNQVLEILDYWKTIEFLGQINIKEESSDNRKVIEKINKGEKVKNSKIEVFSKLTTPYIQIDDKIEKDAEKYTNFTK